jgi:probable HAF family extracellular repeat protein
MRDLGSLPGFESGSATAINNHGRVVGELYRTYTEYRTTSRAFLWEKGQMRNLGAPAGCSSTALAINDGGQIVGFAQSRSFDQRALLWEDGRIDDLNTCLPPGSGWTLQEARAINNRGQIVGIGTFNGERRGFLLTPQK